MVFSHLKLPVISSDNEILHAVFGNVVGEHTHLQRRSGLDARTKETEHSNIYDLTGVC